MGPVWLLPVLELALLVPLSVAVPTRHARETIAHRVASLSLVALVSAANVASLILLVDSLLNGVQRAGQELIFAAMQIWLTNVIVFGLWYWELDRGGPRRQVPHQPSRARLPLSADVDARGGAAELGAHVPGLPVRRVYECHGIQSYRHAAAHGLGQGPDGQSSR